MFELIAFYFFSALSLAMFLVVITTKNVLYALTALASGMIFISAFFFLLGADFIGVVQITVYTGAVIVMYAFGMMFFDSSKDVIENHKHTKTLCILSFGIAIVLTLIFGAPIISESLNNAATDPTLAIISKLTNIELVGYILFTRYLIPFEVAAVMLLVAMIGGVATGIRKVHFPDTYQDTNEPTPLSDTKEIL